MVAAVVVMVMVAAVVIEEVAVALVDVVVSSGMILCFQKARFSCFLKKHNGHTDGRTYGRTYGRTDIPSYRDARTHLKSLRLCWKISGQNIYDDDSDEKVSYDNTITLRCVVESILR